MFRSSGPRSRRPSIPDVPRDAAASRRQAALLQTADLIVAAVDPRSEPRGDTRSARADRRRADVVRYLQAQGGAVRNDHGLVTAHLRAALGQGPGLGRLLREMESDGVLRREVRGRRTFAVRLAGIPTATAGGVGGPGCPGPVDYATFARALRRIITTRLAVTDLDNASRRAQLESYRDRIESDLAEYEAALERADGTEYFERKLGVIARLVADYELRTGISIDDALTDAEHEHLHGVLRAIRRP